MVRITTSNTSATGNNFATIATASITTGAGIGQSATVTAPTAAGTYYVWVIADNNTTSGQTVAATSNDIVRAAGTLTVR